MLRFTYSCAVFLFVVSFSRLVSTRNVDSDGKASDSTIQEEGRGVVKRASGRAQLRTQVQTPGQVVVPDNLKVAAFNVRIFGVNKMKKPGVADILVKILDRYDIILIQEIRDNTNTSIFDLVKKLNRYPEKQYELTISPRLGRSVSKEQYAFLYRADRLTVKQTYVYDDGDEATGNDTFEREPYVVSFYSPTTSLQTLTFIAIHTSPLKTVSEIDQLAVVYDDTVRRMGTSDVIILGDFNAACSYVSDSDWKSMRLATDKRFHWLISECVDTTVAGKLCAYDRFVAAGDAMLASVVPGSAKSFFFDRAFGLTEQESLNVSDHYPIELQLYSQDLAKANSQVQQTLKYSFKSTTDGSNQRRTAMKMRYSKSNPLLNKGFTVLVAYSKTGRTIEISLRKTVDNKLMALQMIQECWKAWPTLISESQVIIAAANVDEIMNQGAQGTIWLELKCDLNSSTLCWISFELDL